MWIIIYSPLHSGKNIKQTNHLHQTMKLRTSETVPPQLGSCTAWNLVQGKVYYYLCWN